jgi:dihydroorotase
VYPIGAITKGRAGKELAEMGLMFRAGAVAVSDDGDGIADTNVCRRAMQYTSMFDRLFIQHCEDKALAASGCMNAGPTATRLGLPGIPALAEEAMLERDLALAKATGVRYHAAHVSTRRSVELIREAKRDNPRISAEVCPHHLLLTDDACAGYDPNFKMNPPLRTQADVQACLEGVCDGTIDCLVTDHAPHSASDKERGFQQAPFGIIGLETALPLFLGALVQTHLIDLQQLILAMSARPAQLLKVGGATLAIGARADITLFDPAAEWVIDPSAQRSRSRNTPFGGWKVRGRATCTIVAGEVAYEADFARSSASAEAEKESADRSSAVRSAVQSSPRPRDSASAARRRAIGVAGNRGSSSSEG